MTVLIQGDRIVGVGPSKDTGLSDNTPVVVDGTGKFLIPSLWDMHVHIEDPEREFGMFIANGVLGVRDLGGVPEDIFRWREEVASGRMLGPRIVACGPIVDGPTPTNPRISVSVSAADDARETVRSLAAAGADCVKVHDGVPLDAHFAIAAEVKKVGLPLVGHVPVRVRTLDATNAGQRSIEHQIGLRGASTVENEVMETEEKEDVFGQAVLTGNFQLIPEDIANKGNFILDNFSDHRAQDLYRAFARNGTHLVPTLVTGRSLTFVDEISKQEDLRMKYVPSAVRKWWEPQNGMLTRYRTPAYIAFRKREFSAIMAQIPVAHRAGVQFLAGTDTTIPYVYSGFSLHDEIGLFVKAGLTPMEALQTATINPVRFLGSESSMGMIQPGKLADLVLLDGNPLDDISNTKKISAIVIRGGLLRRNDLDAILRRAEALANR